MARGRVFVWTRRPAGLGLDAPPVVVAVSLPAAVVPDLSSALPDPTRRKAGLLALC